MKKSIRSPRVIVGMICVLCVLWNSSLYFDAVWMDELTDWLSPYADDKFGHD